ncbi:MAG: DUF3817 domain-containing protein [Mycobacteriaceae bacterium]
MTSFFDLTTHAKRFRFVAVLEAISWTGLLIGMYFKYFTGEINKELDIYPHEIGVKIFGMFHGFVFVVFLVITVITAIALKWSVRTTILGLLSSLPPLFTVLFEVWAVRNGQLAELSAPTAPSTHSRT